jgi:hypothetical protein
MIIVMRVSWIDLTWEGSRDEDLCPRRLCCLNVDDVDTTGPSGMVSSDQRKGFCKVGMGSVWGTVAVKMVPGIEDKALTLLGAISGSHRYDVQSSV